MIVFPNCKINIGLHVIRQRNDGFHDLETVFYPLAIKDALEITLSDSLRFSSTGLPVDVAEEDNICVKAYQMIRNDFPDLPIVHMHLHKAIPIGSGLGGGSADGAFMLSLVNEKFKLNLSVERLIDYSLRLGSDCPFFVINNPCYATGRGEFLQAVPLDLSNYRVAVVCPDIHINTAWAFEQLKQTSKYSNGHDLKKIIQQPVETWKEHLMNDFERPVFDHYPAIKAIKDQLYDLGALYAAMTGSGSGVYGIFREKPPLTKVFPTHYFVQDL